MAETKTDTPIEIVWKMCKSASNGSIGYSLIHIIYAVTIIIIFSKETSNATFYTSPFFMMYISSWVSLLLFLPILIINIIIKRTKGNNFFKIKRLINITIILLILHLILALIVNKRPGIIAIIIVYKLFKAKKGINIIADELKEDIKKKETLIEKLHNEKKIEKKNNWVLVVITICIILSLLGFAFYWFEYRPTQIKKDCSWKEYKPGQWREAYEGEYEKCIRKNGLK